MIETGKPFKMKPKTRKAENALHIASVIVGCEVDDLAWEVIGSSCGDAWIHVSPIGGNRIHTGRWIQTQDDPDWEIVK